MWRRKKKCHRVRSLPCREFISALRNTRSIDRKAPIRCRSIHLSSWFGGPSSRLSVMASTVEAAEMRPDRAVQEITKLVGCGTAVELIEADSQCYAFVKGIIAPSPPWSKKLFDILIAIPAVFDAAELDGFYVELPCLHSN